MGGEGRGQFRELERNSNRSKKKGENDLVVFFFKKNFKLKLRIILI